MPIWKRVVDRDLVRGNHGNGYATVHGTRPPEAINQVYGRSLIAVDFTGASEKYFGHYNRTTLEPMSRGCAVLCRKTLCQPHSVIPADAVYAVESLEEARAVLNGIVGADSSVHRRKLEAAYELVKPLAFGPFVERYTSEWSP